MCGEEIFYVLTTASLKEKTARHSTLRRVTSAHRFVYFSCLRDFMLAVQSNSMGNYFICRIKIVLIRHGVIFNGCQLIK